MSYGTFYSVFEKSGSHFCGSRTTSNACFASYAYGAFKGDRKIEVYVKHPAPKSVKKSIYESAYASNEFTPQEVERFAAGMSEAGFLMSFADAKDECVLTAYECDYYSISHVRVMLDFTRSLWESGMPIIYRSYLNLPKEVQESVPFFEALQILAIRFIDKFSGHRLPCATDTVRKHFTVFTREQMLGYFNEVATDKNKVGYGSWAAWSDMAYKYYKSGTPPPAQPKGGYYYAYLTTPALSPADIQTVTGTDLKNPESLLKIKSVILGK